MRLLFFLVFLVPVSVAAEISVVASVRPLYQVTAALTRGVNSPLLLIGDSDSAHHFSFRPSHFRTLQQADLVIWIDRNFESGFQQLPQILPAKTRALELIPALGLDTEDGHIWYSPNMLMLVSTEISRVLAELDPDNRSAYQKNLAEFQQNIENWQHEVQAIIARQQPALILDHAFLHHFESAFGLEPFASIYDRHDQHAGIGSLQAIEETLRKNSIKCIISNENHISRTATNLAGQFSLSIHRIESFAGDGDPATRFARHLQHFASILRSC